MMSYRFLLTFKFLILFLIGLNSYNVFGQGFVNSYDGYLYGHPTFKTKKKKEVIKEVSKEETANANEDTDVIPKTVEIKKTPEVPTPPSKYAYKLRLSVLPSYMTVQGKQLSNGSIGIMNSSLYPAYKFEYSMRSSAWNFFLLAGRKTVTFENSIDRTIMTPTHTLYRLELTASYTFGPFSLGAGTGFEDKFFYKIVNTSFADADTARDHKFYAFGDYEFFRNPEYRGTVNAKVGFNPKEKSDVYQIQTGIFYSTSLKFEKRVGDNKNLGLELYYKGENYTTQQLKLQASEIGLGISFSFDWGNIR
jgi:hypothetical protein